jgi:serine/threonine protein phosphatase PrpC
LRPPPGLTIEVAGLTDKGRVRPGNEDNLIFEDPSTPLARAHGTLLVVSDGMGGHAAGEVASQIAVETIHNSYYRNRSMPPDQAVHDAIASANGAIYEAAQQRLERAGMGCTVVALVVHGPDLIVGHVGDSRAYLIRAGQATQLTLDHSWVAMQVHEGILTPEQAEHHPNRSVLMRALGRQASVEVDISHRQLQPGDILLACSDGLTGMVTDAEIAEYAGRVPLHDLPRQLIDLANSRGAPDNITVLVGAIGGTPTTAQAAGQPKALDPNDATTVIAAP